MSALGFHRTAQEHHFAIFGLQGQVHDGATAFSSVMVNAGVPGVASPKFAENGDGVAYCTPANDDFAGGGERGVLRCEGADLNIISAALAAMGEEVVIEPSISLLDKAFVERGLVVEAAGRARCGGEGGGSAMGDGAPDANDNEEMPVAASISASGGKCTASGIPSGFPSLSS
jgi:hypothetical protein